METQAGSPTTLNISHDGGVAVVTLNRPARLNALSLVMAQELIATAEALGADPAVRAVVLTGAGPAFCAGADLVDGGLIARPGETRGAATKRFLDEHFNPMALAWFALPKPVVVAMNGVAAGGGVGLALTGDLVLAAASAQFIQVFVPKLGLAPDLGCSWQLPRLVGGARAKALTLLGEPLPAARAAEWGLIHACVPDASLSREAMALAQRLAAGPTAAQAAVKRLLDGSVDEFAAVLSREAELQGRLGDHPDHAEGVAAFVEKRKPVFGGR